MQQEPLIVRPASHEGTQSLQLPVSLYFGIGICNQHALSAGLPVDVLSMILVGERLGTEKHILIADAHAAGNGFRQKDIDTITHQHKRTLAQIIDSLHLRNWQIHLASDIEHAPLYREILTRTTGNDYLKRELADTEWFRREKEVNLKLGWALNGSRNSSETSFDLAYMAQFQERVSFCYVEPGKTLDRKRPNAPPYFCGDPGFRILLQKGEDVAAKMHAAQCSVKTDQPNQTLVDVWDAARARRAAEEALRMTVRYFERLARLYAATIEPLQKGPIEYRMQQIVDRCVQ